jgi:hypothetical protein
VVLLAVVLAVCSASGTPLEAKVRPTTLVQLARESEYIVLARVEDLLTSNGLRVAKAVPQTTLKGVEDTSAFYFVAERTWTCDTSTALKGETALLFLCRSPGGTVERELLHKPTVHVPLRPLFFIGHSGRGRMPLRVVDGLTCVMVPGDVLLGTRVKALPRPNNELSPGRLASLSDIRLALAR